MEVSEQHRQNTNPYNSGGGGFDVEDRDTALCMACWLSGVRPPGCVVPADYALTSLAVQAPKETWLFDDLILTLDGNGPRKQIGTSIKSGDYLKDGLPPKDLVEDAWRQVLGEGVRRLGDNDELVIAAPPIAPEHAKDWRELGEWARVQTDEDLESNVANLMSLVRRLPGWKLVLTATPEGWRRVERRAIQALEGRGSVQFRRLPQLTSDDIREVGERHPNLGRILEDQRLRRIVLRPRVLDLVAQEAVTHAAAAQWVSEADVIDWFFDSVVERRRGDGRRSTVVRLAARFADNLAASIPEDEVNPAEADRVGALHADRVLRVQDGRLAFDHPLLADWSKRQYLVGRESQVADELKRNARRDNPSWHRGLTLFYRTTILSNETDPNNLHDLKASLDAAQVYSLEQVERLSRLFIGDAPRDQLDPILDGCVATYQQSLDEDGQVDFKGKAKAFVRAYQFLASVLPYTNREWEELSTFLNFLIPKLPAPKDEDLSKGVLESIDMESYRNEVKEAMKLTLPDQHAEIDPVPTSGGGRMPEPVLDRLSNIIKSFNDQFGNIDWKDADRIRQVIAKEIPVKVAADEAYQNAIKNSDKAAARLEHDRALQKVVIGMLADHTELFKQFSDNPGFKKWLADTIFSATYGGAA